MDSKTEMFSLNAYNVSERGNLLSVWLNVEFPISG